MFWLLAPPRALDNCTQGIFHREPHNIARAAFRCKLHRSFYSRKVLFHLWPYGRSQNRTARVDTCLRFWCGWTPGKLVSALSISTCDHTLEHDRRQTYIIAILKICYCCNFLRSYALREEKSCRSVTQARAIVRVIRLQPN